MNCSRFSQTSGLNGFWLPPPGIFRMSACVPSVYRWMERIPRSGRVSGTTTIAPAASPKSTQVARSFQSEIRVRSSAPITSTFFGDPPRANPRALADPGVGRVDAEFLHQVIVRDLAGGEICAGSDDARALHVLLRKRRGRLQRARAASRRGALRKKLLAAPRRRGEVLLKMLLRERFRSGQRVQDRAVCGAPVRDHRDALDPEQGSAAHLLVIDALLHLLELRLDQKSTGARHPARLDLALEELSECPDGALRRLQQHVAGEPVGRDHVEQSGEDVLALDVAGE